ncbi:MAG TPA: CcmD family protein [Chloroflexota bacterium]|jgi:CcmD family protein
MENGGYLIAAYAIVWLAIGGYVAWLGGQLATVRREIATLQATLAESVVPKPPA